MPIRSRGTFLLHTMQLLAFAALAGCALTGGQGDVPGLSPQRIAEIVASPDRTPADRTNDIRRKPEQLLAFIGVKPGMIALDISAAGGYTTELLARATGPAGLVLGQSQPREASRAAPAPTAPEGNSNPSAPNLPTLAVASAFTPRLASADALALRQKNLAAAGIAAARIVPVVQRFDDPVPPEYKLQQLDLVTLMFNYHDLGFMGVDRAKMNAALFQALKPGGVYVIADHAGRSGTGISESGTLHRIEEAFLVKEVEAAGFKLRANAAFLRNPSDPRDRNTPEPPQPKDDFVLKFVRP